jgi:hypothetical protein
MPELTPKERRQIYEEENTRLVAVLLVSALCTIVVVAGCSSPSEPVATSGKTLYTMPAEILVEVKAERDITGKVFIDGSTNLPNGTKVGVEVESVVSGKKRLAQDFEIFISGGKFRSEGFTAGGSALPAGKHTVRLLSHFNNAWQTDEIIRIVGKDGANLPVGRFIRLDDPNLVDSDRLLDYTSDIHFPPVTKAASPSKPTDADRAIVLVKNAILVVDGSRSSETVENGFKLYMKSPEIRMGNGWSANSGEDGVFTVSLSFIDGKAGLTDAIWTADLKTGKVQYRNKPAKYFSWIPKD